MEFMSASLRHVFGWNMQIKTIDGILLLIVWLSYTRNRRLPLKSRNYFIALLGCSTLNLMLDIAASSTAYLSDSLSEPVKRYVHLAYFVSLCVVMCSMYLYVLSMEDTSKRFLSSWTFSRCAPLLFWCLAMIPADLQFYIADDGAYAYGQMANFAMYGVMTYFIFSVLVVSRNVKRWKKEQIVNTFAGFAVWVFFAALFEAFRTVQLSSTGLVIMLLLNYLVFEDPKVYLDFENGNFNGMAYRVMLSEYFKSKSHFTVFQIGFAEFPLVHGKYGHAVCQEILQDLARIIEEFAGVNVYTVEEETLGFILEMDDGIMESMIRSILEQTEYNWSYKGNTIHVTGILYQVNCPEEATSQTELEDMFEFMKSGSTMMRHVKASADLIEKKRRYATITRMLEHAFYNDGFDVYYQPIFCTRDGKFHSAEALLRLKDTKTIGFVSPEEFITIAEKEGLIMQIGEIVLSKVCAFARLNRLIEKGIRYLEVNLSGIQCIDQGLPEQVERIVERYQLPYDFLNLEITETAAVESGEMLALNMNNLMDRGVTFSMDDFGTGYSNLAKMAEVSYDLIKIDKSLVWYCYSEQRSILKKDEVDPEAGLEKSRLVLAKVIKMIAELNLKIVVEGVETADMVDMLTESGVDYLQGYYYSRPLKEEDFLAFLATHNTGAGQN